MKPGDKGRAERSKTICAIVAHNVRAQRKQEGMTQAQCSRLLSGANDAYWRGVETGGKQFSLIRLVEMVDVLGCSASELLAGV